MIDHLLNALKDYSTIAGAINTAGLGAVGGILLKAWHQNRQISLENRKVTVEENSGLRKEFIEEMHSLRDELSEARKEISGLRDDNGKLRREVDRLRDENGCLRHEVGLLRSELKGTTRAVDAARNSAQRVVIDALAPPRPIMDAMRQLDELPGHQEDGDAN